MEGKYTVEVKAYNKVYGMVAIRKVFKGNKKKAYENAMRYAYQKAEKFQKSGVDFSVTLKGENWLTATKVNPV